MLYFSKSWTRKLVATRELIQSIYSTFSTDSKQASGSRQPTLAGAIRVS